MNSFIFPENPTLSWRRALTFHQSYELLSQNELIGKLRFEEGKKTSLAETTEGTWIFRNTYLASPHISIWTTRREFVAMFDVDRTGNGTLLLQNGSRLKWEKARRTHDEWYFKNIVDEKMIQFLPMRNENRYRGSAYLYPECRKLRNCTLITLLGWNIISVLESGRNIKLLTE